MLPLDNGKTLDLSKSKTIPKLDKTSNLNSTLTVDSIQRVANLSDNTFRLSNNFNKTKRPTINKPKKINKVDSLSDPRLLELELTPNAKTYIKVLFSPFAAITYILQKASIAFNKTVAASISFLVFNLMNVFSSASTGKYEMKLPMLTICLVGSILGARDLVKSIKQIVLSVPEGLYACSVNVFCKDCSIFEFISGIDKRPKKRFLKKVFSKKDSK